MSKFIKRLPTWVFIFLVVSCFLYSPLELSRIIYISIWQHSIIGRGNYSPWVFVLEIVNLWTLFGLGIILVWARTRKVRKSSNPIRKTKEWDF